MTFLSTNWHSDTYKKTLKFYFAFLFICNTRENISTRNQKSHKQKTKK